VRSLVLGDLIDWSSGFWVMFRAVDDSPWSIVEAGLDAVAVARLECDPSSVAAAGAASTLSHGAGAPNPFSSATTIRFESPREGPAQLAIYGVSGRLVRTLVSSARLAVGDHEVLWDGRDDAGRGVASGTYFWRLTVAGEVAAGKLIVVR
jgi:hypothetical protein